MTPVDRSSTDYEGEDCRTTAEEPGRVIKEGRKSDTSSVNMQKSVDEKPTRSKHGVDSLARLRPSISPSKPKLNNINTRQTADRDDTLQVLHKLERLNIRDDESRRLNIQDSNEPHCLNIRDSDSESESGVSSCESDSEDSKSESRPLPRRAPTLRKRGPNGVFQQFGSHIQRPAVASYSESNQRINFFHNETEASEDVLETPGQILDDEGKIRGFLQTPPHRELPVLAPNDLTCLSGSSPEHVSTSDYGSLPGSPYETPVSVASPGSVLSVQTLVPVPNQTPDAQAQSVDLAGADRNITPTHERLSEEKLRKMRYKIKAKPDHKNFLLINENGNSQLTICLAQMAHKVKDFDDHLICAMIDFCSEKKAELLWYRNVDGETPLLIACGLRSHPTIARHLTEVLIRVGHQFEERYDGCHGNSLLHALALRDDRCYPCLREVLDLHSNHPINGLDINSLNAKGLSPLHLAVLNENPSTDTIQILIRHGANPCIHTANPNYAGNAIHLALRPSAMPTPIIEALLSQAHNHCANLLTAVDQHNETPIQLAVKRFDLGVSELTKLRETLHRCGADVSSATPYDMLGPG